MGFECLNGRLRQCHIPPSFHNCDESKTTKTTSSFSMNNNVHCPSSALSLLPFTLPNGIITTFELSSSSSSSSSSSKSECNNSSTNNKSQEQNINNSMSFMLHQIQEMHCIKGSIIIDHCWSIIQYNPNDDNYDNHDEDTSKSNYILVLAILTRLGKEEEYTTNNFGNDNTKTIQSMYMHESKNTGNICTTISIYSRPIQSSSNESSSCHPSSSFTHLYTINLHHFAICLQMDDHILVIGSYVGAIIYDIHEILYKSSSSCCTNIDHEDNDDDDDQNLTSIRIMKPCIVQAISLSYPYFAAASGDRVGVWRIDNFKKYFHYQKQIMKQKTQSSSSSSSSQQQLLLPQENSSTLQNYLVAIWSTKVDNGSNRITSLEMIQTNYNESSSDCFIALSCWDGSAFVYRRCENTRKYDNNHYNDYHQEENSKERWVRVDPNESSIDKDGDVNNNNSNSGDGMCMDRKRQQVISWEDSVVDADVIFPTFVTLFSSMYHDVSDLDNQDNNTFKKKLKTFMAVSRPNHKTIRCYDLNLRKWVKDVGLVGGSYNQTNCNVRQGKETMDCLSIFLVTRL